MLFGLKNKIVFLNQTFLCTIIFSLAIQISLADVNQNKRNIRSAVGLYRNAVEPAFGGKVPEASFNREELNKVDSSGLKNQNSHAMSERLKDVHLHEKRVAPKHQGGGFRNPDTTSYEHSQQYTPYNGYQDAYQHPEEYHDLAPKPQYSVKEYVPKGPSAYAAPKPSGPVLLAERPYEVKQIRKVSVTLADTSTSFDCRNAPYPNRHYADLEAQCTIYHFCHESGQQDTFHCSYGTFFNEYLGTCDHIGAANCETGNGFVVPKHEVKYDDNYGAVPVAHQQVIPHSQSNYPSYQLNIGSHFTK